MLFRSQPPRTAEAEREVTGAEVDPSLPLAEAVEAFKRARVQRALQATDGNQSRAAAILGIQPSNLSRMLKKMNA